MTTERMSPDFPWQTFLWTVLIVSIWVNVSEVFRYFAIVMPAMREDLSALDNVAPMDLGVFLVWGVWDTILVCFAVLIWWLVAQRFGASLSSALLGGTVAFLFFLLFWLGAWNMNLADGGMIAVILPLAWIEMIVAALIARWCFSQFGPA